MIYLYLYLLLLDYSKHDIVLIRNKYWQVKYLVPKTREQLVVDKFSVGCKCHNHNAFKACVCYFLKINYTSDLIT